MSLIPQVVQDLLNRWGYDHGSEQLIRIGGANYLYRFAINGQGYYGRLTTFWPLAEIEAAVDYWSFLASHGAPVCRPLPSFQGHYIERLRLTSPSGEIEVRASVATEAPGLTVTNRCRDALVYDGWGRALARYHLVAAHYHPADRFNFKDWEGLWARTRRRVKQLFPAAQREYELIDRWIETRFPLPGGFGIIHADCNAGNAVWDGREVQIIDFDEPMVHFFAADVARPFRELTHLPGPARRYYLNRFLAAYDALRPLDGLHIDDITWLVRMKNVIIYCDDVVEAGISPDTPGFPELAAVIAQPVTF